MAAALLGCIGSFAILFCFAPDQYAFYPRCLLRSLTGLQCAGCGGLRAIHCLLHGHITRAFQFNPLVVLLFPISLALGAGCILQRLTGRDWLRPVRRPCWLWLFLAVTVAFAIGRNF